MSIDYYADKLYDVQIDTVKGDVILGGVFFIEDSPKEAYIFERAYIMGREHKKAQVINILSKKTS